MKQFDDIYKTLNDNLEPISRSVFDLGIILKKAYELAENSFFGSREVFDLAEDSPIALHRTTVERMLLEVKKLDGSKAFLSLNSKGIENMIMHLYVIEKYLEELPGDEAYYKLVFAGQLKGMLRILVDEVREGVVGTIRMNIIEAIDAIEEVSEKIKYLKKLRLYYKQNSKFFDIKQQEQLMKFIDFEEEKQELDVVAPKPNIPQPGHHVSVATGAIANFNYGAGAVQNLNTGAGAQQNAATAESVSQSIGTNSTSLDELLKQLAHLIVTDNAFAASRQEMEQQLETVKVQLQKPEPKKGIIKRAFESITELAADGAGVMAGHAIFELLHKAPELLAAAGLS